MERSGRNIFEKMLAACMFDEVNENITHNNFPIFIEPSQDTKFTLVHPNENINTRKAEHFIEMSGLMPATFKELLLFVYNNPDKQKDFPIAALGSRWLNPGAGYYSPIAYYQLGQRLLGLHWRDTNWGWGAKYRFLACETRS